MSAGTKCVAILTGDGPEHRYVVNRLCGAFPVSAVVVDARVHEPSLRRAFRGGFRRGVARVGLFVFRRIVGDADARAAALVNVLGREETAGFVAKDRVVRVEGINSARVHKVLERVRPDLLLVFGTSIVRDEILAHARGLALNLHTGMSPDYRGTDCAFWPIVEGEPELIGATVHECTSAVDGGRIFGTARAEWQVTDGLHELFARAVVAGAELYVEIAREYLAGGAPAGRPQDLSVGREYRGFMRTLGPELRARRALRRGLLARNGIAHSRALPLATRT